ncbi:unnamed protein product [Macrosiphum euphorbiae]|uniref:Uncharacterized protein n=1 Tax=Macrosiphum euphorbiae TaxID=13131 RepID=A0AAV0X4P3_9HEMI|nr:unnamed protein product [Macrosiphum euphorbiae]CAI6363329.1 unnamed protein product [Macrosiphum euphorbiae]
MIQKSIIQTILLNQIDEYCDYLEETSLQDTNPPNTEDEMEVFIKLGTPLENTTTSPNLTYQIQMYAPMQLLRIWIDRRRARNTPEHTSISPPTDVDNRCRRNSDNDAQYPPWYTSPQYIESQPTSPAVDENDGPTSFNQPPSILDFTSGKTANKLNKRGVKRKLLTPSPSFFDKPSDTSSKRGAQHLTPLDGVKRSL